MSQSIFHKILHIFMKYSHVAQFANTHIGSSGIDVVQSEVSYNQEPWIHEYTHCEIKS